MAAIIGFHTRASILVVLPSCVAASPMPDTPEVLARLSSVLGPAHDPISQWVPNSASVANAESSYAKQAWWAEQVAEARRARLPMLGTARDQLQLANQEEPQLGYQPFPRDHSITSFPTRISEAYVVIGLACHFSQRGSHSPPAPKATTPLILLVINS